MRKKLEFGLAQRITYVGELGYELYVPRERAAVWDALTEAASPEPVGYQALDSLRIEKGYRSLHRHERIGDAVRGRSRLLCGDRQAAAGWRASRRCGCARFSSAAVST